MKTNFTPIPLAVLLLGFATAPGRAGESAVVTENHVNVRGQASLSGEVITQIQKDEKVVILEEISVENPKKGEPAKWARIQMPANTPVWVFAPLVDSANKSIKANRLNLRAGPGENFSVVGRLDRGQTVKEIRTVDEWMEIEPPAGAYAFVAAEFLAKSPVATAPTIAKSEPPTTPSPAPAKHDTPSPTSQPPPPIVETPPAEKPPTLAVDATPPIVKPEPSQSAPVPDTVKPPATDSAPEHTAIAPALTKTSADTSVPAVPAPTDSGPPPKRIVRREGIVRSTKSIQAPTYFELVNPETRRVINYLHTEDASLKLKELKGKRIVVTGEEGIDPRWPSTPLIEIQTLEIAP